ncbi:MAG TPA: undecaprenyl-diphosphate phosphatase [Sphingobacteriaceae bacterium]|nr:undecaprenyl-diphosphate phosphatase [Sphingobacteriaceae bacterium]
MTGSEFSWWHALILGVVQGATEFLPVSSSGHLVLVQSLLGLELPGITFEVTVHLGTLLAVLAVYRREIWQMAVAVAAGAGPALTGPRGRREFWRNPHSRLFLLVLIGSVPAALLGLLGRRQLALLFTSLNWVAVGWLVTGVLLLLAHRTLSRRQVPAGAPPAADLDGGRALWVGLFQGLALVPGISRSGSTVTAALLAGVEAAAAARFSFLLAIPAIAGAALLDGVDVLTGNAPSLPAGPLLVGFAAAAASGYLAIRWLLSLLAAGRLLPFALYCWVLALITLLVPLGA